MKKRMKKKINKNRNKNSNLNSIKKNNHNSNGSYAIILISVRERLINLISKKESCIN